MDLKGLLPAQWNSLFAVRRSVRYHDRRVAFFELLHRLTAVLTVSVAGFLFVEMTGSALAPPLRWLVLVAGIFAIFDFVVGYAQRADQHRHLRRQFCELEVEMALADKTDESVWRGFYAKRLHIEIGEPPIYRALDLLCHNEQAAAEGHRLDDPKDMPHFARLRWWHRWSAHVYRWPDIGASAELRYPTPKTGV